MSAQPQPVNLAGSKTRTAAAGRVRKRNILPGFGLSMGVTLAYLSLDRAYSALDGFPEDRRDGMGAVLGGCQLTKSAGRLSPELHHFICRSVI